jgi:hypothetical protein
MTVRFRQDVAAKSLAICASSSGLLRRVLFNLTTIALGSASSHGSWRSMTRGYLSLGLTPEDVASLRTTARGRRD